MENFRINIFGVVSLFGTLQGLILAFIFIFNKNYSRTSNRYLTVLLLVCSTLNFIGMLEEANLFSKYPILFFLPIKWYALIAPVAYFFVQYLINPNYKFRHWGYWLFLPFVLDILFQIITLILYLSGNFDGAIDLETFFLMNNIFETIAAVMNLVVSLVVIKTLWTYEQSLYNEYAEISDKSLQWLVNTWLGGCLLTLFWLGTAVLDFLPSITWMSFGWVLWLGISILIYWIGYAMLMRRELFIDHDSLLAEVPIQEHAKLSEKTDDHYQNVLNLMEEKELFRDPNLNMDSLAEAVGLSKGYLSQIINSKEEKNFFDFINSYRVEDVKEKLNNPSFDHYNILGIALEAGFKSKSTFNSVFKKMTGMTPSQFKRNNGVPK